MFLVLMIMGWSLIFPIFQLGDIMGSVKNVSFLLGEEMGHMGLEKFDVDREISGNLLLI